jgi:hypothetical protein
VISADSDGMEILPKPNSSVWIKNYIELTYLDYCGLTS